MNKVLSATQPKVVLVSDRPPLPAQDDSLLHTLIVARVELFCAVGCYAEAWEEAMDWFSIQQNYFVVTTAHSDEPVEEVIAYAEGFNTHTSGQVQVVHV